MRVVLGVLLAVLLCQLQEGLSQQGDNLTLPLTQTTRALEGVENQVCPQDDIREFVQTTNNQEIDAKLMDLAPIVEPCNVKRYGRVAHCPATSCSEIIEQSSAYPPSGYYWLNGSDGAVARVYCDMVRGVVICDKSVGPTINCSEPLEEGPTSCPLGRTDSCPATSCSEVQQNDPSATSDYFWIQLANGTTTQVYCEMTPRCACSSATPYTRVAFVNMTDSSQQCPGEFMEVTNSRVRACGRQTTTSAGCNSAMFSALGMEYQHVCGRIIGWQIGSPAALYSSSQGIDSYYIDGISITYGGPPREHIWSLAGTPTETYRSANSLCPCSNTGVSGATVPSFVGNDLFCETGIDYAFNNYGLFYEDADPLWDGEGCGSTSTCCEFNNPPWFCKQLPQPTTEDIEVRICDQEGSQNDDTPFELIEIYIR